MADVTGTTSRPPTMAGHDATSLTGLNEDEAKSFGNMFVVSFLVFLAIAVVAHWLVWQWRCWIPGCREYPAGTTGAFLDAAAASLTTFLA